MKHKHEHAQIIILSGVILTITVVVVASIAADLAHIGVGTLRIHSKSTIPEFINIRTRFGEILEDNINEYEDIEYSFNTTYSDIYYLEIQQGNFLNATLNDYNYSGGTIAMFGHLYFGQVVFVNVTLALNDGTTHITDTVIYPIKLTGRN
jgi:hypothetical protein